MPRTRHARWLRRGVWLACGVLLGGCASVRSLTDYKPGDPVFFAGSRLDAAAIRNDQLALKKFTAQPPRYPMLDLPFSVVADLFFWLVPRTPAPPPGAPNGGALSP